MTPRATRSAAAWGGVIGPAAFVGGWVTGAIVADDLSPIDDAISRLAAVGAETRGVMSAGFVVFGIALPVYATALRRAVAGPAWIAAAVTGLSTIGVALAPLDRSAAIDTVHAVFAGVGYLTLAATPLLAAGPLRRRGHRALAGSGIAAGVLSGLSLAASLTDLPTGLFQRIGLTVVDAWIVASALVIVSASDQEDDLRSREASVSISRRTRR